MILDEENWLCLSIQRGTNIEEDKVISNEYVKMIVDTPPDRSKNSEGLM